MSAFGSQHHYREHRGIPGKVVADVDIETVKQIQTCCWQLGVSIRAYVGTKDNAHSVFGCLRVLINADQHRGLNKTLNESLAINK